MTLSTLLDNIAENLMLYIILFFILLMTILIVKVILTRYRIKYMETAANIELDRKKQEIMEKKLVIEELRNSAIILNDRERKRLEEIKTDNALLSRKLLYHMNEAEERTKRLELGSDNYSVINTLQRIREHEQKLFGRNMG